MVILLVCANWIACHRVGLGRGLTARTRPRPPQKPASPLRTIPAPRTKRAVLCRACDQLITDLRQRIQRSRRARAPLHEPGWVPVPHRLLRPGHRLPVIGPDSWEYPWFAGFAWRCAHCGGCGRQLGWAFPIKPTPRPRARPPASSGWSWTACGSGHRPPRAESTGVSPGARGWAIMPGCHPPSTIWCNLRLDADRTRAAGSGHRGPHAGVGRRAGPEQSPSGKPDPVLAEQPVEVVFGQPEASQCAELLATAGTGLRWVHLSSAGLHALRQRSPALRPARRRVPLTTSSGVFAEPCAQHALALMLAAGAAPAGGGAEPAPAAGLAQVRTALELGAAAAAAACCWSGYGAIAQRLAELLRPFDVQVEAVRRRPRGDEQVPTHAARPAARAAGPGRPRAGPAARQRRDHPVLRRRPPGAPASRARCSTTSAAAPPSTRTP